MEQPPTRPIGRIEVWEAEPHKARGYVIYGAVCTNARALIRRDGEVVREEDRLAFLFLPTTTGAVSHLSEVLAGTACWFCLGLYSAVLQTGDIIEVLETAKEVAERTADSGTAGHSRPPVAVSKVNMIEEQPAVGCLRVEEVQDGRVNGSTARGYVTFGEISKSSLVRVLRDEELVCDGYVAVLFLPSARGEAPWLDRCLAGSGCWLRLDAFEEFEGFSVGDIVEVLETREETATRTQLSHTPRHAWRYRKST